jgi:predicted O-methyltransferase YrrM
MGWRLLPRALTDPPLAYVLSKLPDPCEAEVDGRTMMLNIRSNQVARDIYLKGAWEPFESALVRRLVRKEDIAVDLGANIGYYTLMIASCARKVYAFEPEPESFALLSKNVALNGGRNVVLVRKEVQPVRQHR